MFKEESLNNIKEEIGMNSSDKKEQVLCCPVCKSTEIKDMSPRKDNGIIGPGYASWKLVDLRACKKCGVVFTPVE